MRRWTPRLTLVALATIALAGAGPPAVYASCPALDLACLGDEAVGAGESLLNDTINPVDTPLDDAIDPAVEAVDPVVGAVRDRVDHLLGDVGVDPPDPVGGGGSGAGGTHSAGHGPRDTPPRALGHGGPPADGSILGRPGLAGSAGPSVEPTSGTVHGAHRDRSSGNRFGAALGGVARSVAIVLALFGLVVAFVAIQNRLDRNDPRLALAPVESDVVEFA